MQKQDKKRVNIFKSFAKNITQIKEYKGLLIIALSLAIVSAILTTSAPNQLSKLTDEISSSLNIDNKKMEDLSKVIFSNLQLENPGEIEYKGTKITLENQQKYLEVMKNFKMLIKII